MNFIKKHPILVIFWCVVLAYVFWVYLRPVSVNPKINKESIHYVNDMYYSNGSAYENLLDEKEQKLYMVMLKDIGKNKVETKFEGPPYECDVFASSGENSCNYLITKVLEAIVLDHPELIQWGAYSQIQIGEFQKAEYRYNLRSNALTVIQTAKMLRMIDSIKKKTQKMDEVEKIKYVYEWVTRSKYEHRLELTSKNQSAFDVFNKKTTTSAGFAKASQIIFQNIGIESYLVIGNTTGLHMWNIIKYKDKYYYFDSTYAATIDKTSSNYYSGIGVSPKSYELIHPEIYPKIDGEEPIIK